MVQSNLRFDGLNYVKNNIKYEYEIHLWFMVPDKKWNPTYAFGTQNLGYGFKTFVTREQKIIATVDA